MAFGIVDLNTAMTGINDYHVIKNQEDSKGMVQQSNLQNSMEHGVEVKLTHVRERDDVSGDQRKFDARDKGSNEYAGDGGSRRRQNEKPADGKVIPKQGGFDMKI